MLRRIGLRGLDPALFERPKSGFVLPFDRWIRRGLKDAMDQTLRDPQAIAPVGLDPEAVARLWRAFLDGAPGHVLVAGLVGIRVRPLVSPQPRFPLNADRAHPQSAWPSGVARSSSRSLERPADLQAASL